jgi:sialic acid synthase SpsE
LPLIKKVAQTGKPIIVSTGLASISDLHDIVEVLKDNKCNDFVLLKCTSTYPASPINSNILTIPHMMNLLNCDVGLSDHTLGIGAAVAAISHGACLIEKHFTLNRDDGGVDSDFSLEPKEFKLLRKESERAWEALGKVHYGPTKSEFNASKKRRSIYVSKNILKGDILTSENIKIVRPGLGLSPKMIDIVIGREVKEDIKKGTALSWDLIK